MMTGDAYVLPISVTLADEQATDESFKEIEVMVGGIRKTMSDGDITYDEATGDFLVKFSQEDTFHLRGKKLVQMRVKFTNGDVIGVNVGELEHEESTSKEVI